MLLRIAELLKASYKARMATSANDFIVNDKFGKPVSFRELSGGKVTLVVNGAYGLPRDGRPKTSVREYVTPPSQLIAGVEQIGVLDAAELVEDPLVCCARGQLHAHVLHQHHAGVLEDGQLLARC